MNWDDILHIDSENTVKSRKQRVRILLCEVFDEILKHVLEGLEFPVGHGLDDKFPIVTEEEETATLALRLSRSLDCLPIEYGMKRFDNVFGLDVVLLP